MECVYIVLAKYQIAPSKAVEGVDQPKSSHFVKNYFFFNQTPSCICSMCLNCIGKHQIVPLKAVVGVDRPMKAPSMHIQKPY